LSQNAPTRRLQMKRLLALAALALFAGPLLGQQTEPALAPRPSPEDIVKLRNAGLPENLISFVTERKQLSASVPAAGAAPAPMPAAVATARGSGVRTRRWRSSLPSSGLSTRTSSPRKSRWTRSKGEKRERVRPLSRSFGGALASGRYFFAGGWGRRISSQSNAAESVRSSVAPLNRSFGDSAYAKTNLSSFAPFFQTARGTASA
jgi:hypothetical protein